jgi:lipid A 3-O-deacylase
MGFKTLALNPGNASFVFRALRIAAVFLIATGASAQKISDHPSWEVGGFAAGGFTPDYEIHSFLNYTEEVKFFSVGVEAGRMLSAVHGKSFLRGRPEAIVEVIPYWEVDEPKQTNTVYLAGSNTPFSATFPGYKEQGISITPLMFRWNLIHRDSSRFVPWAQGGLGLLWTPHNFPQGSGFPGGDTSRINFQPQIGIGESIFVRKKQSLNLGVRGIHVTNAGLGQYNPGVNAIVQFTVGYSWWK